jgi:diguanylate cyclase (GGDEF)-like protein
VDRFKATNDAWGHVYGDLVLRRIASVIGCGRRCYDVLGRWGGDEFLLILPETGIEEAKSVAQRMTAAVAVEFTQKSDPLQVTVSAGVGDSSGCMNADRIIQRADHAMYRAKAQGGNCVAVYEPAETLVLL